MLGQAVPKAYQAVFGVRRYVEPCGLEKPLLELVKMRASQINGRAFCLDMHYQDAGALGEADQRGREIDFLPAWRETPFHTDGDRARGFTLSSYLARLQLPSMSGEAIRRFAAEHTH